MSASPTTPATGAQRIRTAFRDAAAARRAALVPYLVCGRPSAAAMPELVGALVDAGADVIELGVPFSDPLADGPVIRDATRRALDDGMTVAGCIEVVRAIRSAGIDVPIVLMGYVNPLLAYGIDRFCIDAAAAGVDGLIVPDAARLASLREGAAGAGLALTMLVTPLTDEVRLLALARESSGFLYVVATTGTTGAREEVAGSTIALLERTRRSLASVGDETPIAVGFGISTSAHVAGLAAFADGVIVGSALVALVEEGAGMLDPAVALVRSLAAARCLDQPL